MSQLLFLVSGLALSVKACRLCQLPKGDGKPSQSAPPKGELWISAGQHKKLSLRERLRGFSLLKVGRSFLRSAALSQKAALQMPSSLYDPSRENGISERPQAFRYPEI